MLTGLIMKKQFGKRENSVHGVWRIVFVIAIGMIFCSLIPGDASAIDAEDIVKRVQDRYKKIDDVAADMEQVLFWKLTQAKDTTTGKIYLKKKDFFRWEIKNQTFVTDGNTVWTYSPVNNQTVIDRYRPTEDTFLPQQFIFSFGKDYRAELAGEEEIDGKGQYVLILRPVRPHDIVRRARVWVDKRNWITQRIEYEDINENLTTYNFYNIQFDKNLQANLFRFQSPPGTEIIDMR